MANDDQNRKYFDFYLMGRDEAQDAADDIEDLPTIDIEDLARRTVASISVVSAPGVPNLRDLAMVAAKDCAAAALEPMKDWLEASRRLRREIKEAGGDTGLAYKLFTAGYIDELAQMIENEVLVAISEDEDDDDEEEDEGEDESPAKPS